MNQVTQPVHAHDHRVWVVPDSPLGKWAAVLFSGAALTVILAPLLVYAGELIVEPGADTPWFFALWGAMLMALALALIAGGMALIAMIRDHALLLVLPVALGLAGTAVVLFSAGWPI